MPLNASGGIGSLNVTLINETSSFFGVKIAEVLFYKQAIMGGYTSNTTAFSELLVLAAYLDEDSINWWGYRNQTENLNLTQEELFNKSMILNASFMYELEGYIGHLEFGYFEFLNMSLYYKTIDLRELQLVPGEYNVTLRANKLGYKSLEFISPIVIFKRDVYIEIVSISDILTIEEPFSISVNLYVFTPYPPGYENFLRVPVNISFTIIHKDTGLIEDEFRAFQIVQSVTLQDVTRNDTLPGNYAINITIESEYYEGNTTYTVEIVKKKLDISLDYDTEVEEDEEFEIEWELEGGNFEGNPENMTLIIYVDGDKYDEINLNPKSSGDITLELDEGDHEILFLLESPFYTAEEEIEIKAEEEEEEEEELPEPTWWEQNWLWLLIVIIILIGISTFAMMMLYSRQKIKVQKGLESKLNSLKKKIFSKEKEISRIEKQISQIAGIYWILVVHSEQGITMVEINDFKFKDILGDKYQEIGVEGIVRDSALIGGFLTLYGISVEKLLAY